LNRLRIALVADFVKDIVQVVNGVYDFPDISFLKYGDRWGKKLKSGDVGADIAWQIADSA
jgi:hypothetical protein